LISPKQFYFLLELVSLGYCLCDVCSWYV